MIRIDRGPEPQGIRDRRRTGLARALLEWVRAGAEQGKVSFDFDGYEAAKHTLWEKQHQKCVYCDRQMGYGSQPAEHFRPKGGALRSPKGEPERWDRDHYWWLAWSWQNLLFACTTCNGSKLNQFPLEPGSDPLPLPPRDLPAALLRECFATDVESPLMLDPALDDPLDHIEWRPANPGAPVAALRWRPIHKTRRGRVTIDILGWEPMGLADHVNTHITRVVHPHVERLFEKTRSGDENAVRFEWEKIIGALLDPGMPFLAATHDALAHFVSAEERRRWGLHVPRPGAPRASLPPTLFEDPPGFTDLPIPLQWELRALGDRADPERRDRALMALCRVRPSTVETLSALIGLSVQHVRRCMDKMVDDGTLRIRSEEGMTLYLQG